MVVSGNVLGVVAAGAVVEIAGVVFGVVILGVAPGLMVGVVDPPAFATAQLLPAARRQESANATAILVDFTVTLLLLAELYAVPHI
jgi:hypothetical protein